MQSDGEGTIASFTLEYELKPEAPEIPEELQRQAAEAVARTLRGITNPDDLREQ